MVSLFAQKVDSRRSEWVDYAKGITIIGVALRHAGGGVLGTEWIDLPDSAFIRHLWPDFAEALGSPLFFFLIGLFVVRSVEKMGTRAFVVDRCRTLLYPYLLWQTIQIAVMVFIGGANSHPGVGAFGAIVSVGFKQFWFLHALLLMLPVFLLCRRVGMGSGAIGLLAFGCFEVNRLLAIEGRGFLGFFIFLAAGLVCAPWRKWIGADHGWGTIAAAVILPVLAIWSIEWPVPAEIHLLLSFGGIFGAVSIAVLLAQGDRLPFVRIIGIYSLEIYCLHHLFSGVVRDLLIAMGVYDFIPLVLWSTVAGVSMSWACGAFDRRHGLALFRLKRRPVPVMGPFMEPTRVGMTEEESSPVR